MAPFFQRNRESLGRGLLTSLLTEELADGAILFLLFFLSVSSNGLHSSSVDATPTFCREKYNNYWFLACCTFNTAWDKPPMQLSKWSLVFKYSFGDLSVT